MDDINVAVLCGRLTRDAELSYTGGGYAIGKFSIAVNSSRKKGDEWEKVVSFFNCVIFGKRAEALQQFLEKGKQIVVSGALSQNRWEDKEGKKHSDVNVIVESVELCGPGKTGVKSNGQAEESNGQNYEECPF